ncbi:hypothetical protein CDAR_294131 [Caerostris darwini]|uniref:Uncharacterized protein n=1 Tax=Caerostris darwini TaxID=1538125 RepID=A0AAV4VF80_9ARAC|nr:hypothetical protein CDAR_294131 [Caerostris darwini]
MLLQTLRHKATHFVLRTDSWKPREINGGADRGLTKAREIGHHRSGASIYYKRDRSTSINPQMHADDNSFRSYGLP